MEAAFCAEKIEQRYGRRTVLKGCTVVAAHGECVGVAGRNGSGKSTLLGVLAGVRKPTSGTLRYEGRDLLKTGGRISGVVAYVPQTNPLIEELTAKENLQLLSGRHVREEEAVCERLQLGEFFRIKDLIVPVVRIDDMRSYVFPGHCRGGIKMSDKPDVFRRFTAGVGRQICIDIAVFFIVIDNETKLVQFRCQESCQIALLGR